jgi:ABC-2 type transport system ATP-binding protein
MPKPRLEERIRGLLTHLGLWDRRTEAVVKWNRGMKQKLAIARALLHGPALVFLDEPAAGAGSGCRRKPPGRSCRARLASGRNHLSHDSQSGFLTTHNLAKAEKLCRMVAVVRGSKLLAVGSPAGLRSRGGQRAEIRRPSAADRASAPRSSRLLQARLDSGVFYS